MVNSKSSGAPFRPGTLVSDDGSSAPPRRRSAWLPVLFVIFALILVLAVVLSANGGKNLVNLFKALDIPLPAILMQGQTAQVVAPIEAEALPRSTHVWPWFAEPSPLASRQLVPMPEKMCQALTAEGQEEPSFTTSGERGWECSILLEGLGNASSSSLFLQVRGGEDAQFNVVRVKFNLADGRLDEDLARRALTFLKAATVMPPSQELDEALTKKMMAQRDFYFVAGYHAFVFRREIDDPDRYNLIGFNRRSVGSMPVETWPKPAETSARESAKISKGPRLLVHPRASH